MVRRGLAGSREQARAAIEAGRVTVAGAPAAKPARLVDPGEAIRVSAPAARFVSRGGVKLEAALDTFGVPVDGRRALDAGASTGGFTDCLLQRGAATVVAVDVGYGQLHERLRHDDRVVALERTNVRELVPGSIGGPVDLTVADLSFISLRLVAPALLRCTTGGGDLVLLVKPQFEAGRREASRGRGVIREPDIHARVLTEVQDALKAEGATIMGTMRSPITGAEGNVEFFIWAKGSSGLSPEVHDSHG